MNKKDIILFVVVVVLMILAIVFMNQKEFVYDNEGNIIGEVSGNCKPGSCDCYYSYSQQAVLIHDCGR